MGLYTDNPVGWQDDVVRHAIAAPIVSLLFVSLRIYTRSFLVHSFGFDDVFCVLTLLSCIAFSTLISITTHHNLGMHKDDMSKQQLQDYWKWDLISSEFYLTSLLGYKLAIICSYYRLFNISKKFRMWCYIVISLVVGYLTANIFTMLFGCRPIDKFWLKEDRPGKCMNDDIAGNFYGAFNMFSDLMIVFLPLPMIWKLKTTKREKVGLTLIFLIGAIAFVVALVRWIYVLLLVPDRIYYGGRTWMWAIWEVNTGLICACSMTLKPFFRAVKEHLPARWTKFFYTSFTRMSRSSGSNDSRRPSAMTFNQTWLDRQKVHHEFDSSRNGSSV